MQLGTIDRVLTQQALITGQVRDSLTERPTLYPPAVTLLYQTAPGEPERRYPLTARLYRDGRFVFPGDPATTFPRLSAGGSLDLLLRVSASRYQTQEIPFSLSSTDLTPGEETRVIDGRALTLPLLEVPLFEQTIDLQPEPLHLNGRIVEADDPGVPIANADASITEPLLIGPLQTDADGYFTFYDLPAVDEVRLQVQRTGFVPLDTVVTLDYRQPVNQMTYALVHS